MTIDDPLSSTNIAPDYVSAKLWREAHVFAGGTFSGVSKAITTHPEQNCLKFGAAFGIGMATTLVCEVSKAATPTIVKEVLATSATLACLTDLAPRIDTAFEAWKRTWQSPKQVQADKSEIGLTIGQYLVDTALTSGAGIFGAKLGTNKFFHRALTVPGVKHIANPALNGLEQFEKRMSDVANGLRIDSRRPPNLELINLETENDMALMKARIFGEEAALEPLPVSAGTKD
jgi:hypothetical protein